MTSRDQRVGERVGIEAEVRMRIETDSLAGVGENRSSAGIMITIDEPIQVTLEINGPSGPEIVHGRLVRAQAVSASSLGVAVEFDR